MLTMALVPFALPGVLLALVLALALVLPVVPLALGAAALVLLARLLMMPLRLVARRRLGGLERS